MSLIELPPIELSNLLLAYLLSTKKDVILPSSQLTKVNKVPVVTGSIGVDVADGDSLGVGDSLADGVGDSLADGVGDSLADGVADALGETEALGVADADSLADGVADALALGV